VTELTELQTSFREVMAGVATPVSVVTAMGDGLPRGTGRFRVNVLGSDQSALALAFARKGGTGKFDGVRWEIANDLPRLPGAPGWLACDVTQLVDGGDHVVALGTIVAADTVHGAPLTYHGRLYGTHAALHGL
jgi:flavin reductase (DIM6/NTAB) family NADH-FMN oxidoreductase RutF